MPNWKVEFLFKEQIFLLNFRAFINLRELKEEESQNLWTPIKGNKFSVCFLYMVSMKISLGTNNIHENHNVGDLNTIITISGRAETVIDNNEEEQEARIEKIFVNKLK